MGELHQITPFLHVPDLPKARNLLTEILGFEVKFRVSDYAYLAWGSAALRLLEERGRQLPGPGEPRLTVYLDVPDLDALWTRLRPGLATLPPEDVMPPRNRPWKQREFHVRLLDGPWLAFGMASPEGRVDQGPSKPF